MNYTIHQLNVFAKIVETKSVTKAANLLFMTQPAVSIQLKKLQDQFDLPLTEIVNRRIFITDFGYNIYEITKRILAEFEEIQYTCNDYKGLLSGKLKIASASTGKYIIPYYLSSFLENHPSIDFQLMVSNRDEVVQMLLNNQIDFAFISLPIDNTDMETEEMILVENNLHLFTSSKIKNIDLATIPFVVREEGSATRKQMEKFLLDNGIVPSKIIQLTSNEAVKQMVCSGYGCSIMPILGMRYELKEKIIKIHPHQNLPLKTYWRLVWLKQKKLSPVAKGFIKFLEENYPSINENVFDVSTKK
jgi:DNA-binding transcriptional LysR family regulator